MIFAIYTYCFLSQVFKFERVKSKLVPLCIPPELTVKEMLERVLRLPAVASKRYLTNKVGSLFFLLINIIKTSYIIVQYMLVIVIHFHPVGECDKNVYMVYKKYFLAVLSVLSVLSGFIFWKLAVLTDEYLCIIQP